MNAQYAARGFADAFALVIAIRIAVRVEAQGKVLRALFARKPTAVRFTPERLQLLVVTWLLAGWYGLHVLAALGSSIPPVSNLCIWVFGISSTFFAAGEALRKFDR